MCAAITEMAEADGKLVDQGDVDAYERDGAVCIRGVLDDGEIELLREEIEQGLERKGAGFKNHTERNKGKTGRFAHMFQMWQQSDRLASFTANSRLVDVVADLMRTSKVNLFFDQAFAKEPGTVDPTPWHVDQTFWPLTGRQVITTWVALDEIDRTSGGVEFVAGSHLWNRMFQPKSFSGDNDVEVQPEFEQMPDIEADRSAYNIISWDMNPGDILTFNGMTLHGAPGNATSDRRRRGYAVRYSGDDAVYTPRPSSTPDLMHEDLVAGGPIDSVHYPVVPGTR
ncbi:MAG: phytanoyl-CoA dioxygenase family protein [Alphaproteobacteria bacterium]|nr:phytanoyl-CoA dioxygenase family protein [Alphaproteobacteria bacterium]